MEINDNEIKFRINVISKTLCYSYIYQLIRVIKNNNSFYYRNILYNYNKKILKILK